MSKRYGITVRNTLICANATNYEEFIGDLQAQIAYIENLHAKGALFDADGVNDDFVKFYTEDAKLAEELGFEYLEDEDDILLISEVTANFPNLIVKFNNGEERTVNFLKFIKHTENFQFLENPGEFSKCRISGDKQELEWPDKIGIVPISVNADLLYDYENINF